MAAARNPAWHIARYRTLAERAGENGLISIGNLSGGRLSPETETSF